MLGMQSSFFVEQAVDFENLIYAVFLFIETLMALPKFRVILKRSVDQLVPYLLVYLQITDDQVNILLEGTLHDFYNY